MSRTRLLGWLIVLTFAVPVVFSSACSGDPAFNEDELILATTTSLNDSGLLDELVPIFEVEAGVSVKIIAVGTGAALRMGAEGDVDVLLTHAPTAERELLEAGDVTQRTLVAYNDFVIVGPPDDPAGVAGMMDVSAALARIALAQAPFASRGDDSGTHKKELELWSDAGLAPSVPDDEWYEDVGQGMSTTLTVANQLGAYTLTDRGTYLALSEDIVELIPLVEGDVRLLNFYSVMEVEGSKGRINTVAAAAFTEFLIRDDVQAIIGDYLRTEYDRALFVPAAGETEASVTARRGGAN
jgi:tungstate transport system substrate-binding protein